MNCGMPCSRISCLEVGPHRVGALGEDPVALVEHLVEDLHALVGQADLVGVGVHQRPADRAQRSSQSLTVEFSSPPTYWIGFCTDGSRGSSRGKTDCGGRGASPRQTVVGQSLTGTGTSPSYVAGTGLDRFGKPGVPAEERPTRGSQGDISLVALLTVEYHAPRGVDTRLRDRRVLSFALVTLGSTALALSEVTPSDSPTGCGRRSLARRSCGPPWSGTAGGNPSARR